MTNHKLLILLAVCLFSLRPHTSEACTGITLKSRDGSTVVARTIEWGGSNLNSRYVIVPRGYVQQSLLPDGKKNGLVFTAQYGYVGMAVEQDEIVAEGINEAGLSAGLFYFPHYGQYETYDPAQKTNSLADIQLVSWILGNFDRIEDVQNAIKKIRVIGVDPRASTVHWRIADATGRQFVLEFIEGKPRFYENKLGVLTNSPDFNWQMVNLNNYVNLSSGTVDTSRLGNIRLSTFGAGSGLHGIPGDITPPSRFVRAAFYQCSTPQQESSLDAIIQSFHILNNFDIPIGIEFAPGENIPDIPSATQWTSATDINNRIIYYRTMYNSTIRCIDLKTIDFGKVKYQVAPLDAKKNQSIERIKIK